MKEIGVGIIGYGFMGKAHVFGYKTLPLYYNNLPFKTKLVGVCSGHLENAVKAKEYNGFEFATDNADDIFERKDIQVVNICTPNSSHKELILKALKADKHVYCEKPLAMSVEETDEILRELGHHNVTTQMVFNNRFFPATVRAKQLIEEGRIGRVLSFRAVYLHSGSVDSGKPIGWRYDKSLGGGGVLFDMGSHLLDLMYHLLGEYESVFAKTEITYKQRPDKSGKMVDIQADDLVLVVARMKNGGLGTIEASKIATGTNDELRFEIHGDKGALRFNLMEPNWLDFYDNTVPEQPLGGTRGFIRIECVQRFEAPAGNFPSSKTSIGWLRGHAHCLYNFLSCVNEGRQANPSFEDGAYIQYVMEKAYESDRAGNWSKL